MKKQERLLLQVLICVALFAGIWIFFLDPALKERAALKAEQQAAELNRQDMDALIESGELEGQKVREVKRAKANYNFFYSVLNSYTIDEIVNGLAADNGLNVQSLQIGEYEDASEDFNADSQQEKADGEEETDGQNSGQAKLLKCSADLTVSGSYDSILTFVDALNAKSSCLRTTNLSLNQNQQGVSDSYSNIAQIEIEVYGINTIEEK